MPLGGMRRADGFVFCPAQKKSEGKMMSMEIMIENLVKYYGKQCALNGVSLTISGGMFGLLGANGSGKTTLMRILATLIPKDEGTVTMDGISLERIEEIRRMVGYLPQDFNMYPYYTVSQALDYIAYLSGIRKGREERIRTMLEWVNLEEAKKKKVRELSGGMKRRLGIAMALIHDPEVLIADEPTAGLDPEERIRFRNLLRGFAGRRTVLLSTHIAGDVEVSCDHLAVLNRGRLLYAGDIKEFIEGAQGTIWELRGSRQKTEAELAKYHEAALISQTEVRGESILRLYSEVRPGETAVSVTPRAEDAYMRMIRKNN